MSRKQYSTIKRAVCIIPRRQLKVYIVIKIFLKSIKNEQLQKRRMVVVENNTKRGGLEGEAGQRFIPADLLIS